MSIKNLAQLQAKKIAILGLGLENVALTRFLLKNRIRTQITICDSRSTAELGDRYQEFNRYKNISWRLGTEFNQNLGDFSLLFRSPGWPRFCPGIKAALKKPVILTSAMNLFFKLSPTKNIIGVSGTKGKGTTATLITKILKTAKKKVFLGGNIGIAPFDFISKLQKKDWVVLELSSFQLEDLESSPKISVITNIYREHLAPADPLNPNYHKTLADYIKSKLNLGHFQKTTDYLLWNERFAKILTTYKKFSGQGKKIFFKVSRLNSRLVGDYNQENIGAAEMVGKILKIKPEIIARALKNFKNLEHRLEFVATKNKVDYYDNSFSTTPESTILDLKSFSKPIILLASGADKGANFKNLAMTIKQKVKFLILFSGTATNRILSELKKVNYPTTKILIATSMEAAVKTASKQVQAGDIVLLSTACASFGLFKNYKERGNLFKKYVHAI